MTPLNFEQMKSILSRVTYRPGWTFFLEGALPTPTDPWLVIRFRETNDGYLGGKLACPMNFEDERRFLQWIEYAVQRIEIERSIEDLKVDGQRVSEIYPTEVVPDAAYT